MVDTTEGPSPEHVKAIHDIVQILAAAARARGYSNNLDVAYGMVVLEDVVVALTLGLQFGLTLDAVARQTGKINTGG